MKATNLHSYLLRSSFILSLLFGGMMILAAPARAQVAGKTYDVTIKLLSTGDTEKACFQFDNANTLTVTEPGGTIFFTFAPKTPDRTDKKEFRWQAVSRPPSNNFGMSGLEKVFGLLNPVSNLLDGNIVSQGGATLTFQGQAKPSCTPITSALGQVGILQQL